MSTRESEWGVGRTPGGQRLSRWISAAAMFASSLFAALAACELALRFFHPKYESVSQSQRYRADGSRIWAPMPNTTSTKAHPDTGLHHPVIYNNFGSRQHRNFSAETLEQAANIAFFGDSFTENSGIQGQYSFTEPLDYLLNLHDGRAFNVLNFGLDGYGPGQQFIWYRQFPHRDELDHIVYVFCDNDIENFHEHQLFSLSAGGDLLANVAYDRGVVTDALSRLHLTYLALDAIASWSLRTDMALPPHGVPAALDEPLYKIEERIKRRERLGSVFVGDAFDASIAAFQALLLNWKTDVEENGGQFHVVVLPYMRREDVARILPAALDVSYLHECFSEMIPDYHYSDWRFREDAHWNEAGNMVAAHCLYRFFEDRGGLPRLSDETLASARYEYYKAVGIGNWTPPTVWATSPRQPTSSPRKITAKYMALDRRHEVLAQLDRSEPLVRANWDIYRFLRQPEGPDALAYVKTPCRQRDWKAPFFLHVVPHELSALPENRAAFGFDNRDFNFVTGEGWIYTDTCVVTAELPPYPVRRVQTGQFEADARIWEVELALDGLVGSKR